ncbi:MAG TPA: thiol reductant ABC exporter subunit CydC [Candidatus Limnocylindrales bacterium]|nr:thiol reductant ABC exporter subunit CydC [Candidatus Limnocylindrales bacterium]
MRDGGPLVEVIRLGRAVRGRLGLALLAGAGAAASAVALTGTSAWLISRAAEQPPVLYLMVAIVAVRAFGVSRGALRYVERLAAHDASLRILGALRGRAYDRLERLAPAGLADHRSGDLLSRLVADVDGLVDLWPRVVLPAAVALVVGGGAVLVVAALVPVAGLVLAVTLVVSAVGAPLAARAVGGRTEARIAPVRGGLSAGALDLLQGAPELVVAGAVDRELAHVSAAATELARAESRSAAGAGVGVLVASLASGAAVWLALVAGVAAVRSGALGGVALAVVVLVPLAAHELVAGLAPAAQQLVRLRSMADRLGAVLERPEPVADAIDPATAPSGPLGLRIRGLHARYEPGGPDILAGVDLELGPGKRALVTGPSGSGKSTLAAVLLRFVEVGEGSVELVGPRVAGGVIDIRRLTGDDVRRIVGLCAQDAHLFDSTIAENLRFAKPGATDDELRDALARARLLDWVDGLPDGIGTFVGEGGARLSGGQRQRVELARSILADRPILVFDEPTEHLDEVTAAALTTDLLEAAAGRTVLFITHRPELMAAVAPDATLALGA